MSEPKIVVFGSMVMDLVAWAPRRPRRGETLIGTRFEKFLGGKGFNQAVAASRMGATVEMIGALGADEIADPFTDALDSESIGRSGVVVLEGTTGVGMPLVTDDGDVSIVGIAGVNDLLTPEHADSACALLSDANACVIQCEVPAESSARAMALAAGALSILNAAPAGERGAGLAGLADVVVVNEPELAELADISVEPEQLAPGKLADASRSLLSGEKTSMIAVTLAGRGALLVESGGAWRVAAFDVPVVDPTGAGDAFTSALALGLVTGMRGPDLLEFANAAGAVAVQAAGAHPSMPSRYQVESLLTRRDRPHAQAL